MGQLALFGHVPLSAHCLQTQSHPDGSSSTGCSSFPNAQRGIERKREREIQKAEGRKGQSSICLSVPNFESLRGHSHCFLWVSDESLGCPIFKGNYICLLLKGVPKNSQARLKPTECCKPCAHIRITRRALGWT